MSSSGSMGRGTIVPDTLDTIPGALDLLRKQLSVLLGLLKGVRDVIFKPRDNYP